LEKIYWDTAAASPPINLANDIELPKTILLGSCIGRPLKMLFSLYFSITNRLNCHFWRPFLLKLAKKESKSN
jgi:hypothetical protein